MKNCESREGHSEASVAVAHHRAECRSVVEAEQNVVFPSLFCGEYEQTDPDLVPWILKETVEVESLIPQKRMQQPPSLLLSCLFEKLWRTFSKWSKSSLRKELFYLLSPV